MANLTIKKLPVKLHERLKRTALLHRRSLNSEVIVCLELALRERPSVPIESFLASARRLRAQTARHNLSNHRLTGIKRQGRS